MMARLTSICDELTLMIKFICNVDADLKINTQTLVKKTKIST